MLETIKKIWGTRTRLLETESVVLDRLLIHKGGFCSIHVHGHKNNQFFVEEGSIQIQYFSELDQVLLQTDGVGFRMLSPVVIPGEYHRFKALEASIVYEIITNINVMESDIFRIQDAGKM